MFASVSQSESTCVQTLLGLCAKTRVISWPTVGISIGLLAFSMCAQSCLFAQNIPPAVQPQAVSIPFVGCGSDGQLGPVKAPQGQRKLVAISADLAQQLAYYKSEYGIGVVAPRGWHCFGTYGSNGSTLYVTPDRSTLLNCPRRVGGDLQVRRFRFLSRTETHLKI